jgi:hypothetical protein
MSPIRLRKWVFAVLTRLDPARFRYRQLPKVRPQRRPVTLDFELFDRRESPTAIVAVDPLTAHLISFASPQEPLPPVVQLAQTSASSSLSTRFETNSESALAPLSTRFEGSAPGQRNGGERGSSWWRSEVYGDGASATQAHDASLVPLPKMIAAFAG